MTEGLQPPSFVLSSQPSVTGHLDVRGPASGSANTRENRMQVSNADLIVLFYLTLLSQDKLIHVPSGIFFTTRL